MPRWTSASRVNNDQGKYGGLAGNFRLKINGEKSSSRKARGAAAPTCF